MRQSIKVGVVGVGALGRHHARLYLQCPGADLVGVYDRNDEVARSVANEFGLRVFPSPERLAEEVEALSVAVPTDLHHSVSIGLLEQGKHLLIEKPITRTLEEAQELMALANERRLIVQVGHVERFNPVIAYLEKSVDNPRFIECHRLASYPPARPGMRPRGTEVGVVLDLMIHDIDMVLSLVKSPIVDIDSVGISVLSPSEDIANARIKFANGCVANLTASRVSPEPMRKIRVFQYNCYVSLDYQAQTGEIYFNEGGIRRENVPVEAHNALLKQLEHFVACVSELKETGHVPVPKVSGAHGMQALKVASEIIAKMEANEQGLKT